ncbi:Calcium-gated potassium channel MthK [uncultured archaeon]|nr:Calcium-gated potassium channel MthK [uncultured archaeon]
MAEELKDHVIVCGYGLVGENIVDTLLQHRVKVVVIEMDGKKVELLKERGINVIQGDATFTKVLKSAGIERARAIAIAMDDDAKNLFAVITARSINSKIVIATRANDEMLKDKLKEAGAGFVATPNKSASNELFKELTKGI